MADDSEPKKEPSDKFPGLSDAERKLIADAQAQADAAAKIVQGPAQELAKSMKLQQDFITRLSVPSLEASLGRMSDLIGQSASTARTLEGIAALPKFEPMTYLAPPEVAATRAVQDEVRNLAKIAAATAEGTGTLAEVAKESLGQTAALLAAVQQLHDTTKAGIESNEKTAKSLAWAVDSLEGTTDDGLSGTRKAVKELVTTVELLHKTTASGIAANDKSAKSVIGWTRALFVLTLTLALLTAGLLYETYRLVPVQ